MGSITPYGGELPAEQPAVAAPDFHEVAAIWGALARRWRVFVSILAAFVFLVGVVTILMPKSYTTTVSMMAGNPTQPYTQNATNLPVLNALLLDNGADTAETFATLAQLSARAAAAARTRPRLTAPPRGRRDRWSLGSRAGS